MAVNPMQRKSRNSFLLGIIITLLITGIVIIFLFLQLKKVKDEQAAAAALLANVYTLNQDVKSGQILTEDMFSLKSVDRTTIPSNATSVFDVISTWFLQTKDGEPVHRDKDGLYLNTPDYIIEIYSENGGYYKLNNGEHEKISIRNDPYSDDDGSYVIDSNNIDTTTRIYEEPTGNLYIYKWNASNRAREKAYLELNNVPVLAKIDMNANTVITPDLVVQSDAVVTDDVRREEYNMIVLPMDLMTDDYIDIRLMLPNGQNFIVISKTQVEVPTNQDGSYVADTLWLELREDEILALSSAIVEAYGIPGAKLYANKYAEPGMQNAAVPNYTPNNAVTALINENPNIVEQASQELAARYSQHSKDVRNQYLQSVINDEMGYDSNVQAGLDESSSSSKSTRKQYLESLTY